MMNNLQHLTKEELMELISQRMGGANNYVK